MALVAVVALNQAPRHVVRSEQHNRGAAEPRLYFFTRRSCHLSLVAVTVAAAAAIALEQPAQAFSFSLGTSGPKEWLKKQKQRTANFLLSPIARSRERLESAFLLLTSNPAQNHAEALKLVKFAANDCIPLESGSLLDLQSRTGVEVCTFRLLVKNAASLLDDSDPVKVKAYLALDNLIRSLTALDNSITASSSSMSSLRSNVSDAFYVTYAALDNFESGIRACLGIA